jgi:hypothetical protein
MLINAKGAVVEVPQGVHGHNLKGVPNPHAIAVLAPLREVLENSAGHKCGKMFKLETRARWAHE